ncbi:MAG: CDP-glycerol glycerophosphotransferase family protein [Erysipelotrichaceae bacterium]
MNRMLKKVISKILRFLYRVSYRHIKVDQHTVLFLSFHGRGFSDNPAALFEYMQAHSDYQDYTCVWALKDTSCHIQGAKIIRYNGPFYFYYLAKSKYWIVNCKLPDHILKKSNQIYLQTWHGTPLKKLAHDIEVSDDTTFYRSKMNKQEMQATYDKDVAKYNYMISPNAFCTRVFQSAFRINPERLIETGYPRNDFLSNHSKEDEIQVKKIFNLPLDKKIILYAPTWRDNCYNNKGYTFELEVDFKEWQEALGEDYIVIFKPHYLIVNHFDQEEVKDFVYQMPANIDINQLYIIADLLITDYSSVFFDYAILNRPMLFYMYDIDTYAKDLRGFYFDLEKVLPGKILQTQRDLLKAIPNAKIDEEKMKVFHQEFNTKEDGFASQRVLNILFNK